MNQGNVQLLSGMSNLSLSFSLLYTSQGGVYTCETTLSIPEAGISITETLLLCRVSFYIISKKSKDSEVYTLFKLVCGYFLYSSISNLICL